eukprot:CFRG3740T1
MTEHILAEFTSKKLKQQPEESTNIALKNTPIINEKLIADEWIYLELLIDALNNARRGIIKTDNLIEVWSSTILNIGEEHPPSDRVEVRVVQTKKNFAAPKFVRVIVKIKPFEESDCSDISDTGSLPANNTNATQTNHGNSNAPMLAMSHQSGNGAPSYGGVGASQQAGRSRSGNICVGGGVYSGSEYPSGQGTQKQASSQQHVPSQQIQQQHRMPASMHSQDKYHMAQSGSGGETSSYQHGRSRSGEVNESFTQGGGEGYSHDPAYTPNNQNNYTRGDDSHKRFSSDENVISPTTPVRSQQFQMQSPHLVHANQDPHVHLHQHPHQQQYTNRQQSSATFVESYAYDQMPIEVHKNIDNAQDILRHRVSVTDSGISAKSTASMTSTTGSQHVGLYPSKSNQSQNEGQSQGTGQGMGMDAIFTSGPVGVDTPQPLPTQISRGKFAVRPHMSVIPLSNTNVSTNASVAMGSGHMTSDSSEHGRSASRDSRFGKVDDPPSTTSMVSSDMVRNDSDWCNAMTTSPTASPETLRTTQSLLGVDSEHRHDSHQRSPESYSTNLQSSPVRLARSQTERFAEPGVRAYQTGHDSWQSKGPQRNIYSQHSYSPSSSHVPQQHRLDRAVLDRDREIDYDNRMHYNAAVHFENGKSMDVGSGGYLGNGPRTMHTQQQQHNATSGQYGRDNSVIHAMHSTMSPHAYNTQNAYSGESGSIRNLDYSSSVAPLPPSQTYPSRHQSNLNDTRVSPHLQPQYRQPRLMQQHTQEQRDYRYQSQGGAVSFAHSAHPYDQHQFNSRTSNQSCTVDELASDINHLSMTQYSWFLSMPAEMQGDTEEEQKKRRKYIECFFEGQKDGSWLVRYNKKKCSFVLSILFCGKVLHMNIVTNGNEYILDNHRFPSIVALTEYYQQHNISGKIATPLISAISCIRVDPANYVLVE